MASSTLLNITNKDDRNAQYGNLPIQVDKKSVALMSPFKKSITSPKQATPKLKSFSTFSNKRTPTTFRKMQQFPSSKKKMRMTASERFISPNNCMPAFSPIKKIKLSNGFVTPNKFVPRFSPIKKIKLSNGFISPNKFVTTLSPVKKIRLPNGYSPRKVRQVSFSPIKDIRLSDKMYTPTALIDEIFEQLEETLGFTDETYNQLVRGLEKSIRMETSTFSGSGETLPLIGQSKILESSNIFKKQIKKLQNELQLKTNKFKKEINEKDEEIEKINKSQNQQEQTIIELTEKNKKLEIHIAELINKNRDQNKKIVDECERCKHFQRYLAKKNKEKRETIEKVRKQHSEKLFAVQSLLKSEIEKLEKDLKKGKLENASLMMENKQLEEKLKKKIWEKLVKPKASQQNEVQLQIPKETAQLDQQISTMEQQNRNIIKSVNIPQFEIKRNNQSLDSGLKIKLVRKK